MKAFAKLENQYDHALTMQKGGKTAYLASTDWRNDGSTPVAQYLTPAVEEYNKALKRGAPADELRGHESRVRADLNAWPRQAKREAAPTAFPINRSISMRVSEPGRRAKTVLRPRKLRFHRRQRQRMTSKLTTHAWLCPRSSNANICALGMIFSVAYRDDKPDMSIKGQDGIRINKDYAIGDAIAIAKHNGWQSIRVHGSDEFKKAVYLEAARSGVEVKGFKPSEQLKLEGERLAARDKAREAQDPAKRASMAKQDPQISAAEQFRRNSHRDNAANPQFKAAQSHVLAAAIEAKTRFTQKEDRDRFIERAKETVAKRIEVGAPVPAARFEQQRQNEATRIAREDLTLRQQERKPSRSR
ncbi:LPD7 domain-containing protein [Sphingobium scionense]